MSHRTPAPPGRRSRHRAPVVGRTAGRPPWWSVPAFVAGIYLLSVTSVMFAPAGSSIAVWWPAAGVSVAMLLWSPRRWWWFLVPAVAVVSGLGNLAAGRPMEAAAGFGVSNAAEALLVSWWITRGVVGRPGLRTQDDLWRLLSGTVVGGLLMALGGGLTVHYFLDGSFWLIAKSLVATHGAAILVIAPLGLAVTSADAFKSRRSEAIIQWFVTLGVTTLVFAPGQVLPLAFVPMPFLVWGALRLGMRSVSWQLVAVGVLSSSMTAVGGGTFAAVGETIITPETTGTLVQLFLLTAALIVLPLAVAVDQRREALARVSASEELFRSSFSDSLLGMVLLRLDGDDLRIVELNQPAVDLLGGGALEGLAFNNMLQTDTLLAQVARDLKAGVSSGWREEVELTAGGRRVEVSLSALDAQVDDALFSAQMSDVTDAFESSLRLRTEKDFTSAVLNTTGCLIIVVDVDGALVGMNPAAERAVGRSEAEVAGRLLWDIVVPPEESEQTRARFQDRRALLSPHETTVLSSAGRRRQVSWTCAYLNDQWGRPTHVVMTGIDVTDERTARSLVSHVLESARGTSIIGTDLGGIVNVFNGGAEEMLGYHPHEVMGRARLDSMHDPAEIAARAEELGVAPGFEVLVGPLRESNQPEIRDWTYVRKDGSRFTVALSVSPVFDAVGERIGYLAVGRDVTDQRHHQKVLEESLAQQQQVVRRLQELDQAKSDFVSTVSHELRTPITSIVGYTEMLQDGAAGPISTEQDRLIDAVRRNGERLSSLVEDLLTLSSIESGTFRLTRTDMDLRDVLLRAEEALAPLMAGRHLDVRFDLPSSPVAVRGDAGQLERVVMNLISNAVKFTEDGGSIGCTLRAFGGQALLEVSDTGIGIPAEEQGELFSRFFRSSVAHERAIQGTGLGLSIVQSIVRSHGGDITARSSPLEGSVFRVALPLSPAVDPLTAPLN